MSYLKFQNAMRMQASLANNNRAFPSIGKITGYNPELRSVTVEIHSATDDSPALPTGWIPISTPWMGSSCGMFGAPNVGDLVAVHYQEGSLQNAYADSLIFNDRSKPLSVPSGEFWLVHKSGSFLKLMNDGKVLLNGQLEIDMTSPTINITATTAVNVNAPEVNIGNGTFQKLLMDSAREVFNTHTHDSGAVPPPDQTMDVSVVTTNTKAS